MKAILFSLKEDALLFNHNKAIEMGCSGDTIYWWPMIEHNGQFAVLVENEELEGVVDIEPVFIE